MFGHCLTKENSEEKVDRLPGVSVEEQQVMKSFPNLLLKPL